ncbi:hypothetical protein V5O48_003237 [Marasmius crinis-equi]|uniref:Peptidase A1 domain-containing protein n=1 Tax=Marasmius crinis-equi TaxID=585013 RepID=A0ABR3FTD2_9AGAR
MRPMHILALSLFTSIAPFVAAYTSPIFKRPRAGEAGAFGRSLEYSVNITLGGDEYDVLLDTGSSDLYIFGEPRQSKRTDITADLSHRKSKVSGRVQTGDLIFGCLYVEDQAYLVVDGSENIDTAPGTGLIGIGPSPASNIRKAYNSPAGNPVLDKIFRQDMTLPRYITILLGKDLIEHVSNGDLPEGQQGVFTIGSIVPECEHITEMPKLSALTDQAQSQHWELLLDSNGIIGPDGKAIETKTSIPKPTEGKPDQLRLSLDTGFTLPQLPGAIIDQIYGRIPGAVFFEDGSLYEGHNRDLAEMQNFWVIPCDYEVNVTFLFGGKEYPISPLDLSWQVAEDSKGKPVCVNYLQQTTDSIAGNTVDGILGMAFLRNMYMLLDYGNSVDGSDANKADSYIQLLSTVDKGATHLDFVKARLGGIDTTGSQPALLPMSNVTRLSDPDALRNAASVFGDANGDERPLYKRAWFIALISIAAVALVSGVALVAFFAVKKGRARKSKVKSEDAFVPPIGAYKPLLEESDVKHRHTYTDTEYRPV